MTISVKHTKTSGVSDSANSQIVQPSDWNAEHTYTMATGKLVGRTTASAGAFEEITANTSHFSLASKVLSLNTSLSMTGITATGGTFTPDAINMTSASGTASYFEWYTSASLRWQVGKNNTPEGGSNAGSDFWLNAYDDSGAYLYSPIKVTRSTGQAVFTGISSTGSIIAPAATTSIPSIRLPHGTAPTSPTNGDMWTTSAAGLKVYVNSATKTMVDIESTQTISGAKTFSTTLTTGAITTSGLVTAATLTMNGLLTAQDITASKRITGPTSTSTLASFNLPHGAAVTTGVSNGDAWTTTGGFFVRINGTTTTMQDLESSQTITGTKTFPNIQMDNGGSFTELKYRTSGSTRWSVLRDNTSETGSNVGSDWKINRFSDAGSVIDSPIFIKRSTGVVTVNLLTMAGLLTTTASVTGGAGFNLPTGTAPTSPNTGDMWSTGSILQYRMSGATRTVMNLEESQTLTGLKILPASTTSIASIRVPHGSAPTSPTNGDFWTTTSGFLYQINGATKTSADLETAQTFSASKTFGAQSTTAAPVVVTSGTLMTTAAAGAIEFDGKVFYQTSVASSRQIVATKQIVTVQGTKTALTNSITTAQSIFASGSTTLTVAAGTSYRFRGKINLNTGATTHTTAFGFGGTATFTSINYQSIAQSAAAGSFGTVNTRRTATAALTTFVSTTSTALNTDLWVEGIMRINGAGTIIPQVSFSAGPTGTCEVELDSFFELEPIGTNTVVSVGNFA